MYIKNNAKTKESGKFEEKNDSKISRKSLRYFK